jgi:hypothetical protein
MTMFCNRKRAVLTSKEGTACVRVLTAASVAAFAVSFISPANSQPPPEIKLLTSTEVLRFQDFLTKEGYDKVQFVAIAYEDAQGEKLIALKLQGPSPGQPALVPLLPSPSATPLQIPGLASGIDFEAIFIYKQSPATVKSCSSSAGSINCRF